jgi:hypothetical protein
MNFVPTKTGRTKNSPPPLLVLFLDPGSEIQDPGWIKIRIQAKYPGSATLLLTKGIFCFFMYGTYSTLFHLPPRRFHCDGGRWDMEPRTVATKALTVRRSNHAAKSHPHSAKSHPH